MSETELDRIEEFLKPILDGLSRSQRRRAIDKLMRMARRAQAERIAANIEPEGGAMTPRRKRQGQDGRNQRRKMFRNIGKTANLKIRIRPDEGELKFRNRGVESVAATHHYGLTGFVGKTRDGKIIRTKYDARRLLGHGPETDDYLDEVIDHLFG